MHGFFSVPQSLPPYLSRGPPVLLNPERVVPISETERYDEQRSSPENGPHQWSVSIWTTCGGIWG